jgi:hypothetical protein
MGDTLTPEEVALILESGRCSECGHLRVLHHGCDCGGWVTCGMPNCECLGG